MHAAEVAHDPDGEFHFHAGPRAAERLGHPRGLLEGFPEACVEVEAPAGARQDSDLWKGCIAGALRCGGGRR